jgi:CBS domain-containing protein
MYQATTQFTDYEAELTKIQELMYELRVSEIMTTPVITVSPSASMKSAKETMRARRISGLPVTEGEELRGIVSVEDVIRWLELRPVEATVSEWMTTRVLTVRASEPAVQAINKFRTYHVGRLPVMDNGGRLVGIVTPGDIVDRVLRVLDALYREAEPRRRHERPVVEDFVSDRTTVTLRYTVAPRDFDGTGLAATRIKRILEALRVEPQMVRRAGIAAYEAEMNLTLHATNGGKVVARVEPELLVLDVSDDGPGIASIEQAMTPGYSTAPDWIRELGFGAGMGLNNIGNCADRFTIESEPGLGTKLHIEFDLKNKKSEEPLS